MTYNSSDEDHVRAALHHEADMEGDLDYVLREERGRRWLHRMIFATCHINSLSHVPEDADSTAFNEGSRSVGLALYEEIRHRDHKALLKMLEENKP